MIMSHGKENTVSLCRVALGYGDRMLLLGADLAFGSGEFTALLGRNGCGKSTLLRTVAGLRPPQEGYVEICGRRLDGMTRKEMAEAVGLVSTDEVGVENLKVYDTVALGRAPYTGWLGRLSAQDREAVARALDLVGMSGFADKGIDTLSDGERQRVMVARVLAQDTPVILLDEPTAFLDLPNKYEIGLLLRDLARREGKCVVFSTHDLAVALELCDKVALIDGGRIVCGTPQELASGGALDALFEGTPLVFDPITRGVRLRG